LSFFASLPSKLKEQTGNVYENKGGLWKARKLGRAVKPFFLNIGRSARRETDPSPGPRRLMKAPSRSTLSPGRGHRDFDFLCQSTLKIEGTNRGNVYENKGRLWKACGLRPSGQGVLP
jgi:hypothetical protein